MNRSDERREANERAVKQLEEALGLAAQGGGEKYRQRHIERGKLLPRKRIEHLLDPGSFFLELGPLAGFGMHGESPGAGVVGGLGLVHGRLLVAIANDATVKGGAISAAGVRKLRRLAEVAAQNHLPVIYLVESAGADLPRQSDIFVPGGEEFRDISRRSKQGTPTIAVVFGSSTAGGAYLPGMSDYVVMVKERAQVFLAGPPLVRMATGEDVSAEALGGAAMHATVSGLADFLAEDEFDALALARRIVASWGTPTFRRPGCDVRPPCHSAERLLSIVGADSRDSCDMRLVLNTLVDGSEFFEFKPLFGASLICGFAKLYGYEIGVLANAGVLTSDAAAKGAQFIQLCNQSHLPLLFLQNITGFAVGRSHEEAGIIRHGAKLINAVANSTVPAFTVMIGSSFGAGNYGMCGRAYEPRFIFSWPSHRIGIMGPKQLAGVLDIVKREAAQREGKVVDESALQALRAQVEQQIEQETSPYFATARLWDDGLIDPRKTREILGICLFSAAHRGWEGTMSYGVFRH